MAKLTMMQDSSVGPISPRGVCAENVPALAVERQLAIVFSPPCEFNTIVFFHDGCNQSHCGTCQADHMQNQVSVA